MELGTDFNDSDDTAHSNSFITVEHDPTTMLFINPSAYTFTLLGKDQRALMTIHKDGTVEGELENMGEAAAVFVECVRKLMFGITKTQ